MDDYALILNAGSSSLKFCVFERPKGDSWRLDARGQAEGTGTAPHLPVKDDDGRKVADEALSTASTGSDAVDALAGWLRSRYSGARGLGVGQRVVHGGPRFAAPSVVTRQVMQELSELVPLAPLHQPYNL